MTKRMLIDATHAEETRVVVLDGSRLEDFDVETASKKQLKGNIYLAKVVRVEPSLQAAFVEYGGNRHGFLAFSEIHPDYYQIPVADRQRLIDMQLEDARQEAEEEDRAAAAAAARAGEPVEYDAVPTPAAPVPAPAEMDAGETVPEAASLAAAEAEAAEAPASEPPAEEFPAGETPAEEPPAAESQAERAQPMDIAVARVVAAEEAPAAEAAPLVPSDHVVAHLGEMPAPAQQPDAEAAADAEAAGEAIAIAAEPAAEPEDEPATDSVEVIEDRFGVDPDSDEGEGEAGEDEPPPAPESLGGDTVEEPRERRIPPRFLRNYKIQEVIKRRQILLIQVVKEERGTKGAALTTYISLAGRYSVLMPNSPRGGGISRKITSAADRRRLKEVTSELALPKGMGLIVRTAGANRPKPEIKRDCEYLLRLWDDIREHTMRSVAPALIYEEASLIKRSIRDVYSRDVEEIQVDGEEGWKAAHDFMRMLMPSHASKVRLWRDSQPLFARQGVEAQLDAMLSPTVQLRSGGYLVINQAEALVAIDVNSGRATRERNIEETALRTNLEAADEAARQLRLRDLAGLIVIDFIDMESRKHNAMVERRLKEALKNDRARIQVGQISHFGLLEMSRQRLRPSLAETSLMTCPHCGGTGHVRSVDTAALHVLRQVEEEGAKRRAAEIVVHVAGAVAMYILNHKRQRLAEIESRYGMSITFAADEKLLAPEIRIERVRAAVPSDLPPAIQADQPPPAAISALPAPTYETEDEAETGEVETAAESVAEEEDEDKPVAGETAEEGERRRRRRRRRRGGRREEGTAEAAPAEAPETSEAAMGDDADGLERAVEAAIAETIAAPAGLPDVTEHIEGVPEFAEPAGSGAAPDEAAGEGPDGERGNRRRGRRGGRRRRRDDDATVAAVAEPGAEQPDLPAYAGPTPADPFAGQGYDIFAVLEQAEQAAEQSVTAPAAEPEVAALATPEPVAEAAPEPAPAAPEQPEAPTAEAAPEAATSEAAQPAAKAAPAEAETAAEPEQETVAAEPAKTEPEKAEPAVKPIVIGVDETPEAPKKRGWWRR